MEMIKMTTYTTAEVAEKLETTPRTLRKFLRADAKERNTTDSLPGKGSRYALAGKEIAPLKKRFTKWQAAEAVARKERAEKAAAEAEAAVENDSEEPAEDAEEEVEPSTDELAEIDALDD